MRRTLTFLDDRERAIWVCSPECGLQNEGEVMHVDRKKFFCSECGSRQGLDARKTGKGKAVWRCPLHLADTTPARPQHTKEKSA